mgnify:CR=1 FL=1
MQAIKYIIFALALIAVSLVVLAPFFRIRPREKTEAISVSEILAVKRFLEKMKSIRLDYRVQLKNTRVSLVICGIEFNASRVEVVFPVNYSLPVKVNYSLTSWSLYRKGLVSGFIIKDDGKTVVVKYFRATVAETEFLSLKEREVGVVYSVTGSILVNSTEVYRFEGYRCVKVVEVEVGG